MKVSKAELQKALETVKPGLASKELVEQTTSFAFVDGRVITYNDEISISCPVEGLNIEGAIKAEELYKFLSRAPSDELEVEIAETEIIIRSGRAKASLTIQSEIILPLEEVEQNYDWKKLPEGFIKAMEFVHFSCGKDMTRPVLSAVHVKKDGVMEACDSYRVTSYSIGKKIGGDEFVIPIHSAKALFRFPVVEISAGIGWIHFRSANGAVFSARILAEKYPSIDSVLDVEGGEEFIFPEDIVEILSRADVFTGEEFESDKSVEISVEGRKVFVRAGTVGARFEEWTKRAGGESEFKFSVHPKFLGDMLKHAKTCEIFENNRMRFLGKNWVHVACLQKVEK